MKQPVESFKLEKRDNDIKLIIDSLKKEGKSTNEKVIAADLNKLIFKIVDHCHVTPSKAREYLNIIESRGIIVIDKYAVYYNNQPDNIQEKEVNHFFNQLNQIVKKK